jgi:Superinfection immunity protein
MDNDTAGYFALAFIIFVLALLFNFIPWFIAKSRDLSGSGALFLVNFLFGWTMIGWVLCMLWAVLGQTKAQKRFYERGGAPAA